MVKRPEHFTHETAGRQATTPGRTDQIQSHLSVPISLLDQGKFRAAKEWLDEHIRRSPPDAEALSLLAQVCLLTTNGSEAEDALLAAQAIAADLPSVQRNFARLLIKKARPVEALKSAQAAYEQSNHDAESNLVLATSWAASGDNDKALYYADSALKLRDDYAEAFGTRAVIRANLKDIPGAISDAERALQIKPHLSPLRSLLVQLFIKGNNLTRAIEAQQTACEIEPEDISRLISLGELYRRNKQPESAVPVLKKAVNKSPNNPNAWLQLGGAFKDSGQPREAAAAYGNAAAINPELPEALFELGGLAQAAGDLTDAQNYLRRALQIKPGFAEALLNLGVVLQDLAQLDEAAECYKRALALRPDFVHAYYNLGNTLGAMGRLDEAAEDLMKAVTLKPDYAQGYCFLGYILFLQGKHSSALRAIQESLRLEELPEAQRLFGTICAELKTDEIDEQTRSFLVRAITEPWDMPSAYSLISVKLLKCEPAIGAHIRRAVDSWPARLSMLDLFGMDGLGKLDSNPLLLALLYSTVLPDIEMERFLTAARYVLLEIAVDTTMANCDNKQAIAFFSGLAHQCFINDFLYPCLDEEAERAADLKNTLTVALGNDLEIPEIWVAAIASYFPLHSIPMADRLLTMDNLEGVEGLLVQQVHNPQVEREMRNSIPVLTSIEEETSRSVRGQYEEHPYPKWEKLSARSTPRSVNSVIHGMFPYSTFQSLDKQDDIDILVAGCGTGVHPITAAQRFKGAKVLAVDLSLSSLCYAKRKAQQMGLSEIEYSQGDLMRLGSIDRCFDIIESVGVLHHLADPWAGWEVLLSLLNERGLMKLGFYSKTARRGINRIRTMVAEGGYGSTDQEIRRFRQDLMDSDLPDDESDASIKTTDFFSISSCRDLLFHVQEHQLTLPEIAQFLAKHDLQFLGFELDRTVMQADMKHFPQDKGATNLDNWIIYEQANPKTFFGMYQFWVQRRSV